MVRTPTSCPPHAHTPPAPPSDITLAELGFGVAAAAAEPGSGATAAAEPGSGVAVEPGSGSGSGAAVEHRVKSPYIIRMSRVVPAGVYLFPNPRQRFAVRIWPGTIQVSRSR